MRQPETVNRYEMRNRHLFRHLLRKAFLEDWLLKLVALAITIGLWFGVTGLSTPTKEWVTVSLNLIISSNALITSTPPEKIQVELTGDKRRFDDVDRNNLTATIDLTTQPPGDFVVNLSPQNVSVPLPRGVVVEAVVPNRIPVKIEAVAERDLEVRPEIAGQPVAGFEMYANTVSPSRVRVRGPAGLVNRLEVISTQSIDLANRREDFTARQVPLVAPDPLVAVLNTVVDVSFRIGERRTERYFNIPVTSAPGRSVSFSIYGPRTIIMEAEPADFRVALMVSGNGDLTPQVVAPTAIADMIEIRKVTMRP